MLNAAQQDAVATLSGPLLVLAGAGTGKTRVVTHRIAHLIKHGTPPERILAVTFTNKAAAEMQQRAAALLGKRPKTRPEISTFHSLCVRVLRRHIRRLGYPEKFAIYDRGDQESIARSVLKEITVASSEAKLKPGDLINLISGWKCAGLTPQQAAAAAGSDREHLAASGYRRYQRKLKTSGAVDFDDLLLCTEELFRGHPEALAEEAGRFDHLLIDEYQDTNSSQYRIVQALAQGHRNLCVVGDDDQSIYAWRGAEVAHILRFKHDWPEAKIVRLVENYRSTMAILELANRLIAFNSERHPKQLVSGRNGPRPRIMQLADEEGEAKFVVQEIAGEIRQGHARASDFAILFRTNEQPRLVEQELRRYGVPYVMLGTQSFFDRKEVRDLLAYLKAIEHVGDEHSLLRIINTPPRGIGMTTVERLQKLATERGSSVWTVLGSELGSRFTPAARESLSQFRMLIQRYRRLAENERPSRFVGALIDEIDYRQEIDRNYHEQAERDLRWNSVEEVLRAVDNYEQEAERPRLDEFLQQVTLVGRDEPEDKEKKLKRDAVAVLTLHAAKGLEFPQVYLVGMEEGLLPHKRSVEAEGFDRNAIEEERRLCYVGITRAQDKLTMTLANKRTKWNKPRPTIPSRFLFEITGKADNVQRARQMAYAKKR